MTSSANSSESQTGAMDQRLGADDCNNLKDRREPAIQLDKEPAIAVCELNTATQLVPQNNQLMSKRRVLSFKPQLRLEWRGQDGQSETEQPDHFASLGDFITSSTRISFRYTQAALYLGKKEGKELVYMGRVGTAVNNRRSGSFFAGHMATIKSGSLCAQALMQKVRDLS